MVIESLELNQGATVKRIPVGTEVLSVCAKKIFEIGRVNEVIVITLLVDDTEVHKIENREFIFVTANEPFIMAKNEYQYHGTVTLYNQTEMVHVLSRPI